MAQWYIRFDMNELVHVGSRECTKVEKYPDGMFNKAFLLTIDDCV